MKLGFAVLRVVVGGLFMGHGLQKLIGAFGGHGLEGTAKGFESLGLRPGRPTPSSPAPPRPAAGRSWPSARPRRWAPPC